MATINLTVPVKDFPALKETFGGLTTAETQANVKAFLIRRLKEEVRRSQEYAAAETAKSTVNDVDIT